MVDRGDILGLDLAAGLEQVLDEVDAAARAVALVAEGDIGRAGRCAEAAMHARTQDAFEFANVRIGERFGGELGLQARLRTGVSASILCAPRAPTTMLRMVPLPRCAGEDKRAATVAVWNPPPQGGGGGPRVSAVEGAR